MPRALKSMQRKSHSLPAPVKHRRLSNADQRKTRRDVLGLCGPVDQWLAANRAREISEPDSPLSPDEVGCYVEMDLKEGEVEGDFVDPDIYTLCLTMTAAGAPGKDNVYPKIILETYSGWSTSLHAPDWAQWTAGSVFKFRQTKEELMQFFVDLAPKEDNMNILAEGIASVRI